MIGKSVKKIWLVCLCLASITIAGCFHIPDEDWLPSRNKVKTWNIQEDVQVEQALNSFIDWIDIVSSQRNEIMNEKVASEELNEFTGAEDESIENKSAGLEIEDNNITEE